MRTVVGIIICAIACGCIRTPQHFGPEVAANKSFRIEDNTTTEEQLVNRFGPPSSRIPGDSGAEVLTWTGSQINGYYNLGVTTPYIGSLGDEQSKQSVTHTSLIVELTDGIVTHHGFKSKRDGEPERSI